MLNAWDTFTKSASTTATPVKPSAKPAVAKKVEETTKKVDAPATVSKKTTTTTTTTTVVDPKPKQTSVAPTAAAAAPAAPAPVVKKPTKSLSSLTVALNGTVKHEPPAAAHPKMEVDSGKSKPEYASTADLQKICAATAELAEVVKLMASSITTGMQAVSKQTLDSSAVLSKSISEVLDRTADRTRSFYSAQEKVESERLVIYREMARVLTEYEERSSKRQRVVIQEEDGEEEEEDNTTAAAATEPTQPEAEEVTDEGAVEQSQLEKEAQEEDDEAVRPPARRKHEVADDDLESTQFSH
jgi:hypothetical protein